MSRVSTNTYDTHGNVLNGYDYEAQVWVVDGIVQGCEHPASMRTGERYCCPANRYAGKSIKTVVEVLRLAASAE